MKYNLWVLVLVLLNLMNFHIFEWLDIGSHCTLWRER